MGNLAENAVLSTIYAAVEQEPQNVQQVLSALSAGMAIVGERFDGLEYFVGDLIFAGEIFSEAMEILRPAFPSIEGYGQRKKVLLATVEGDFHNIGKNIVKIVLQSKGLEVVDLGVNVPPATIVRRAMEDHIRIIGLSVVLTSAVETMRRTSDAFQEAGIRDQVTIVVGGLCMNEVVAKRVNADYYAKTPEDTAAICLAAEG